jgi:hypothetical protein
MATDIDVIMFLSEEKRNSLEDIYENRASSSRPSQPEKNQEHYRCSE